MFNEPNRNAIIAEPVLMTDLCPRRRKAPKTAAITMDQPADPAAVLAALMRQMDAMIGVDDVSRLTSLSTREIYRRVSENRFPKPDMIGLARKAWRLSAIEAWLRSPGIAGIKS